MRITEIGDYSMVIMKDSEDPPWFSVGNIYRKAVKYNESIFVDKEQLTFSYLETTDFIYSGGKLILFFKKHIPSKFQLYDRVVVINGLKNNKTNG